MRNGSKFQCVLTVALFLLAGCEYTPPGPPWDYPTTDISGKVTVAGQPLTSGWVAFHPTAGTVGNHYYLDIRSDGSFRGEHSPVGKMQVRVYLTDKDRQLLRDRFQTQPGIFQQIIQAVSHSASPMSAHRFTTSVDQDNVATIEVLNPGQP